MTKKPKSGTLSTRGSSDKKDKPPKETDVLGKMKALLGAQKVRISGHANDRMGERKVIYYEVLQTLSNGQHKPSRDRFSEEYQTWEYNIEGKTNDDRELRVGISFEVVNENRERIVVVTVVDPKQ